MTPPNLRSRVLNWQNRQRLKGVARQIAEHAHAQPGQKPVVMFNASSRLTGFSQNSAFSMLTSWGLRLAGAPIKHFVCQGGMTHCVLGTNREDFRKPPPCNACIRQSQRLYTGADVHWFQYQSAPELSTALKELDIDELTSFAYLHNLFSANREISIPLGRLVLPSIRWALRRHTLPDDEETRYLLRQYILSAFNVAIAFAAFLKEADPAAAIIFNGIMYPEATARWVAQAYGLPAATHEVSFQPYSAFFTFGEATAYPIHIPEDFELTPEQNDRLDTYLGKRLQGKFTMAGIQFWPEMRGLDDNFLKKAAQFQGIVPVFTNVVYDTSQVHANQVFPHMFAWLDTVLDVIRAHPETLFVIRAHPDEMRPGTAKQSRESVRDWIYSNAVNTLPNVIFIDSQEYISSYELIQGAKFVIVYNSSIGMEATLLGVPVLCGGKARYTQYPMVFFPGTPKAYKGMAEEFLAAETISVPPEFQRNARRFLYYQLYRTSLSFADYLTDDPRKGFVRLKPFSWRALLPENSPTIQTLAEGITKPAQDTDRDTFYL